MISPIYKNQKIIGYMDTDNSIYVSDRTREHMFFKFGNGFGLSLKVLNLLKEYDIKEVVIRFEKYKELRALVSDYFEYGKRWTDNSGETLNRKDRGTFALENPLVLRTPHNAPDEQLILPLEYFNKGMEIKI